MKSQGSETKKVSLLEPCLGGGFLHFFVPPVTSQLIMFLSFLDYELGDFVLAMDEMSKSFTEELTGKGRVDVVLHLRFPCSFVAGLVN
jgi:hypothetical protein